MVLTTDEAETARERALEKARDMSCTACMDCIEKAAPAGMDRESGNAEAAEDPVSLWHDRWAALFPEPRSMRFEDNVVRNPYCGDCRFCCCPQAEPEPFPMALLDCQVSQRTKDDFYLLDEHTAALDQRGCKALGATGCKLENHLRPIACNLFPYVLVNDRLYLYLVCPAVMFGREEEIATLGARVHAYLAGLPKADLARIAIGRRPEDLAAKYRDLGLSPLL